MAHPRIATGVFVPPQPPLKGTQQFVQLARLLGLDMVMVWDHFQDFTPQALWDKEFSWFAAQRPSPHAFFDFQVLLGHLAGRAGKMRLGVGVTDVIRRHPVQIAQAMMTLAHLTKRPPILGLGAGERENIEPYGLDFTQPVGRLEEALQVIHQCFTSQGPFDFQGQHFRLDRAVMDLQPPRNRVPEVWVAAHGPRMLRLTGQYGDGWYPTSRLTPAEYAAKLAVIHQAARAAGRDPAAITPSYQLVVVLAPTEAAARDLLATRVVRFNTLMLSTGDEWRQQGLTHPFGEHYRGYIDIIPENLERGHLDEALAAMPADLVEHLAVWGTPESMLTRLRAYGEAGMRHVVLAPVSAFVSQRATFDSMRAIRHIAARLRSGR